MKGHESSTDAHCALLNYKHGKHAVLMHTSKLISKVNMHCRQIEHCVAAGTHKKHISQVVFHQNKQLARWQSIRISKNQLIVF